MNLIITLEKEFKGEDIEKLNEELSDAFIQVILSNNEVLKNLENADTFYRVLVLECWMLNQSPALRQKIFDQGIDYLKPRAVKTALDENIAGIFADLQKIMKGVKF